MGAGPTLTGDRRGFPNGLPPVPRLALTRCPLLWAGACSHGFSGRPGHRRHGAVALARQSDGRSGAGRPHVAEATPPPQRMTIRSDVVSAVLAFPRAACIRAGSQVYSPGVTTRAK